MKHLLSRTSFPALLVASPLLAASLLVAPVLVAPSLLAGCSGTETDNPVVATPDYSSPIRFEPEPPAPPGCTPTDEDRPPQLPLWGRSGNYLVGVDAVGTVPRRGLLVLDVSDPAAPRVVAERPLSGYPRQLLVEGSLVTLVIDELDMFDAPPVPPPAALETKTRLVRFDLSVPSAPERLGQVALDGEFWQLQPSASGYWLMSARIDPATQRCDVAPNLCGYVEREAFVFTHYTWSGAGWAEGERRELPVGPRVWLTESGFATASSYAGGSGQLSFVSLAGDGSAGPLQTLPLSEGIVAGSPLYFAGEHVGLFRYELSDGSATFALYALDGTELAEVGGLGQNLRAGTHFVGQGALVASGSPAAPGAYIDFRDPGAPSQVSLPQASAFLPLAEPGTPVTRALGWQTQSGGSGTTFTLWSLESVPPVLLDSLPTTLAAPDTASDLELSGDSVIFALRGGGNAPLAGTLRWQGDALSLAGPIASGHGEQVLAAGGWLYAPDAQGLAFGNPAQGIAQREAWDEGELLDVTAVPGGEARLALDFTSGVQLFVTRNGVTQSLAAAPGARRVLPAGERLIVLSTEPQSQCEQTGLDCTGYVPGVAIVELEPLRVVAELPLPELPVPALSPASRVEQSWSALTDSEQGPVRLGEQRWLLESEWLATCLSEADCAALGIDAVPFGQANVAPGQQSCAPGTSSCPQSPTPTVYGEALRRVSYVLDAAAASLSEPLVVEGARGAPYRLWSQPIFSRDTLLDLHLEPSAYARPGSAPPTSSAFFLERHALDPDGGLTALPVLNIPGYPLALIGDANAPELLTLEPAPGLGGSAQLHRLRLGESAATVLASRALEARVGEVKVVGETVVYVRDPVDRCEAVSHVDTFALDPQLSPIGSLELAGDGWQVVGAQESGLVLQRGHAFARIALDAQGNATVAGFQTAPSAPSGVDVDGDVVRVISANRVLRLEP